MPFINVRWADNTDQLRKNLREGLNQIEATRASAEKMAKSLSGDNLIAAAHRYAAAVQQIGGVEKLTAAEKAKINALLDKAIEKYQALGQVAPTALRELAAATATAEQKTSVLGEGFKGLVAGFTTASLIDRAVTGLIGWGTEAIRSAGATVDLADKLGVSTEAIQRWSYAGKQSGVTAEQFADAAYKLGVRLAGGSGSVRSALTELGLSFKDVMALPFEQRMDVINEALERQSDATKRNQLGQELYGKSFSQIAAAVASGYTKIAKEANVATDAQLRALDELSDKWDAFFERQKTGLKAWLGAFVEASEQARKLTPEQLAELKRLQFTGGDAQAFLRGLAEQERARNEKPQTTSVAQGPLEPFTQELARARAELSQLTAEDRRQIAAAEQLSKTTEEITDRFGLSAAAQRILSEQTRQAAEASKKAATEREREKKEVEQLHEKIRALEEVNVGYRVSVGEVDSTEQKSIETYLAKRKALEDLYATLLKLQTVRPGVIDVSDLGGDSTNELGDLKARFDANKEALAAQLEQARQMHEVWQLLDQDLAMLGDTGDETFKRIIRVIRAAIQALQVMLTATLAENAALAAQNILKGFGAGFGLFLAFLSSGGTVKNRKVEYFDEGRTVGPFIPRGRDVVPAMLAEDEIVLNANQQRAVSALMARGGVGGGVASGHDSRSGGVVVHMDNRGAFFGPQADQEIARRVVKAVSQNKGGTYSRGRAALGLKS